MWRPRPSISSSTSDEDNGSLWQNLPLAFAILPALGGLFFKNGVSVISDILLLGLAAIFLNWSVRLPWDWYKSAQELRLKDEANGEYDGNVALDEDDLDFETESERENGSVRHHPQAAGEESEDTVRPHPPCTSRQRRQIQVYDSSKKELYRHELGALLACFVSPLLAAYLLHSLRNSLSRPSEGLVNNFNLTIFLLAAELRPMSHAIKLVQARTLHLQRIVKDNPYTSVDEKQDLDITSLKTRISELEGRIVESSEKAVQDGQSTTAPTKMDQKQMTNMANTIRQQLQPDLDALNRAVRRYEKKNTLQAMQTESRLLDFESRLGDAVALAAQAARGTGKGILPVMIEYAGDAVLLPWQITASAVTLPWRVVTTMLGFIGFSKKEVERPIRENQSRRRGGGKTSGSERERERMKQR